MSQICNMPKQTEAQPSQILYICKQLGVPTFDPEVFISTATSTAQGSNPKAGYPASTIFQNARGVVRGVVRGLVRGVVRGCAGILGSGRPLGAQVHMSGVALLWENGLAPMAG